MSDTPPRRGGLRNPPGGRPRRDETRGKRIKAGTLFLHEDTIEWLRGQADGEDVRTVIEVIERLIDQERGRAVSAIGMTIHYRSGTVIGRQGVVIDERRTSRGTPEYLVRFDDGEMWLLASNVQF